jgi:hypothetical protein
MIEIDVDFDAIRDIFVDAASRLIDGGLDLIQYAEDRLTDFNNMMDQ